MNNFFELAIGQKVLVFSMLIIIIGLTGVTIALIINFILKTTAKYKTKIGLSKSGLSISSNSEENSSPEEDFMKNSSFIKVLDRKEEQINELDREVSIIKDKLLEMEISTIKQSYILDAEKIKRPLHEHPLLFNLQNLVQTGPEIKKEDLRNKSNLQIKFDIFKEVVIYRNSVVLELVKNVLEDIERESLTDKDREDIIANIPEVYLTWNKKTVEDLYVHPINLTNGEILKGVPKCFLEKFDAWDNSHTRAFFYKMKDVLTSDFYKNWKIKFILIMDILDVLTQHSSMEAKHTLGILNGDLDKELKKELGEKYK